MVTLAPPAPSSIIDWKRGELRPAPRANRPDQRETYYPAICICGNERWLKAADARKAELCGICQRRAAGKLGYAAMAAKYGEKWATRHVQAYRRENPSSLETAVAIILDDLGVRYEREFWLATKAHGKKQRVYLLDFMIAGRLAVEVNGAFVHSSDDAQRRDRRKKQLLKRRGYPLLTLTESDIRKGEAESLLVAFLNAQGVHCGH